MQTFEMKGLWWVPEAPEEQIAGFLKFADESGAELELLGLLPDLDPSSDPVLTAGDAVSVIHGVSTNGKRISLLQCSRISSTLTFGMGASTSTYRAAFAIRGAHIGPFERLRVKRVWLSFDSLAEWYVPTAIRTEITDRSGEGTGRGVRVSFSADLVPETPSDHVVQLPFGEMRIATLIQSQFGGRDQVSLTQEVSFVSEFSEPLPFEKVLHHIVYHLQNLVTLGVGAPISITQMSMVFATEKDLSLEEPSDTSQPYAEVFHETTRADAMRSARGRIHRHRMVFTFDDIRAQWPTVLTRVFESGERIRSVYDLYFATVYGPRLYLQNRFLNLAQAAETFHRTMFGELPPLQPSDFDGVRNRLNALIDDPTLPLTREIRVEFRRKVSYWNQASLRRRIRELVVPNEGELQSELAALVGEPREFCQEMIGTRNYLTHYDPNDAHHVQSMGGLLLLTEKLACILRSHLMRDLGIPLPIVSRHIERCAREIGQMRSLWESDS